MKINKNFIIPIVLFIFCLIEVFALFKAYSITSHDITFHVIRIREYFYEFQKGVFPVRWASRLDNGYGLPLFNYIYPLPYILGIIPLSVGLSEIFAYKIIIFLAYFLGVLGFYYLFHQENKFLAFFSALIYGTTPYVFLNIFVRGALGEILAMGFIPWIIYFFTHNKKLLASFFLALLFLSHNFIGVIFLFFLLAYLIWTKSLNIDSVKSILLAIGISAFFIFPMLLEKNLILSIDSKNFTFNYYQHFLYLHQLFYGKWGYSYSNPGPVDGMSFQLGFVNIIIICLAAIFAIFLPKKSKLTFFLLSLFGSIFLTLKYSSFIWKYISPLQIIQFPWRMLFLVSILVPIIFYETLSQINQKKNRFFIFFIIGLTFLALFNTKNYRRPLKFISKNDYYKILDFYSLKTTTTNREEIVPKESIKEKQFPNQIIDLKSQKDISPYSKDSITSFFIENETQISIHQNYFPSFRLKNIDTNQTINTKPDEIGDIIASVTPGNYQFKYTSTPIERFSNLVSLASIIFFLLSSIRLFFYKKNE